MTNSVHGSSVDLGLDRKLFAGIAWVAIWRWTAQVFSWAMTFYAARILLPGDYGLASMCMIPVGLLRMVEDLGLDAVIVQDRTLSHRQLAELGGLALALGAIIMCGFLAASPAIASFFNEPAVAGMIMVLSITFITDGLQVLPRALLQRDMAFGRLAWINAVQVAVTATALALYAHFGFSHWSLVLNTVTGGVAVSILLWTLRPHAIAWPRNLRSIWHSLTAGGQMLISRIAWYFYNTVDQTIIGRVLGKDPLGAYSFALTFAQLPVQEVTSMVGKVVPGIFSSVQDKVDQLRRYYLLLAEMMSYLTMPMAFGLMSVADEFVAAALGPKWLAVVTPLRILAIYAAFNAAQALLAHVMLWTGRFKVNMYLNFFSLAVLVPAFFIGVQWGVEGVAWSMVVAFPISCAPGLWAVGKALQLPFRRWLAAFWPAMTGCAAMVASVFALRGLVPISLPPIQRLLLLAAAGAAVYVLTLWVFFSPRIRIAVNVVRGRHVEFDTP